MSKKSKTAPTGNTPKKKIGMEDDDDILVRQSEEQDANADGDDAKMTDEKPRGSLSIGQTSKVMKPDDLDLSENKTKESDKSKQWKELRNKKTPEAIRAYLEKMEIDWKDKKVELEDDESRKTWLIEVRTWIEKQKLSGGQICDKVEDGIQKGEKAFTIDWAVPLGLSGGPAIKLFNVLAPFVKGSEGRTGPKSGQNTFDSRRVSSDIDNFINGVGFYGKNGIRPGDPLNIERTSLLKWIISHVVTTSTEKSCLLIRSPAGSGKTSFLQQLLGNLKPYYSGNVFLFNTQSMGIPKDVDAMVEEMQGLPSGSAVVIEDAQKLYEHLDWGFLKTGFNNIKTVIATASYSIGAQFPDSPAFFEESDKIGIAELGLSETEKDLLVARMKKQYDLFPIVFPGVVGDQLVHAVGELAGVAGTDRYHLGLFKNVLAHVIAHFLDKRKVSDYVAKRKDFETFLGSPNLVKADAIQRVYARVCGALPTSKKSVNDIEREDAEFGSAVRAFFLKGEDGFQKAIAKNEMDFSDDKKASRLQKHALIRAGVVVATPHLVWSTLLAERLFFLQAFPGNRMGEQYNPANPEDFVLEAVSHMSSKRLTDARGSSKGGHVVEHALQEFLYEVFSATTPPGWVLCPEKRIVQRGSIQYGRIDFQVNGWGIEVLVEGGKLKAHLLKASPEGKYSTEEFDKYLVVDFYSFDSEPIDPEAVKKEIEQEAKASNLKKKVDSGKVQKAVEGRLRELEEKKKEAIEQKEKEALEKAEKTMQSKPEGCLFLAIIFEPNFETATVYQYVRPTRVSSLRKIQKLYLNKQYP